MPIFVIFNVSRHRPPPSLIFSLVLVQAATRISSRNNKGVPSVRLSMGGNAAIATCHGCQQTFSITDVEWAICRHGLESHWSCLKKNACGI